MGSENGSKKQLKIGALISYISIFIHIVSAMIYSPWMLRMIGSSHYGLYSLASSLINLFLLDFGISSAVTRFVSKYLAEGKQDKVDALLGVVYKIFFSLAVAMCVPLVIVYFFIEQIYVALTPAEIVVFKNVYIIAAVFNVVSFPFSASLNGIMTSYEKFIQMKLCDIGNKLLTILLIVIALLNDHGIYALVAINAAMNLVCYVAKGIVIAKTTNVRVNLRYWDGGLVREIFGFSVWVLLNSICSRLVLNFCPNILGITAGTFAITVFSFASTLEGYTYNFASAIDGMFIPQISRIIYGKKGDSEKLLTLMTKVGSFQFTVSGLILAGFIVVGKRFVSLWIGDTYIDVYYCAVLLMLPVPFYTAQQVGKSAMTVSNKVRYITYVNIVKALVNLVAVFITSKYFGVIGACASICVVYLGRNLANMYLYQKHLRLNMRRFTTECYLKYSIPVLVTLVVGFGYNRIFTSQGWVQLLVEIVVFCTVYMGITVLFFGNNLKQVLDRK